MKTENRTAVYNEETSNLLIPTFFLVGGGGKTFDFYLLLCLAPTPWDPHISPGGAEPIVSLKGILYLDCLVITKFMGYPWVFFLTLWAQQGQWPQTQERGPSWCVMEDTALCSQCCPTTTKNLLSSAPDPHRFYVPANLWVREMGNILFPASAAQMSLTNVLFPPFSELPTSFQVENYLATLSKNWLPYIRTFFEVALRKTLSLSFSK